MKPGAAHVVASLESGVGQLHYVTWLCVTECKCISFSTERIFRNLGSDDKPGIYGLANLKPAQKVRVEAGFASVSMGLGHDEAHHPTGSQPDGGLHL